jgi:peroxiredoxin
VEKLKARRAELVAISVDELEKSDQLVAKLGITFPLLSDGDRSTVRSYGVEDAENGIAWPAIFIVAQDGTIRWRSLADTYKERPTSEVILEALTGVGL